MTDITKIVLGLIEETKNDFVSENKIPLGTRLPPTYYKKRGLRLRDEDLVFLPLSKKEVRSIILLGLQGYGKTKLMKRIISYYYMAKYKILIFEPKEAEYLSMNEVGEFPLIHPTEERMRIPTKEFIPTFVERQIWKNLAKKFDKFSIPLNMMKQTEDWLTLQMSGGASIKMVSYVQTIKTIQEILQKINYDKMHSSIRQSLELRLAPMLHDGAFDPDNPFINLRDLWEDDQVVAISYMSQSQKYASLYTGKILDRVHKMSLKKRFSKLIVIDDAHILIPRDDDPKMNIAKQNVRKCLALWRRLRFNMILSTQSIELIDPVDLELSKSMIVGKIGNPEELAKKVGNPEIVNVIKRLKYFPDQRISQWCLIHDNWMDYDTFYPFQPLCGHTF